MIKKSKIYYKFKKNTRGITLISLIISVIVLMMLANITIIILTRDNGILKKSGTAKINATIDGYKDTIQLSAQAVEMNGIFLEDDNYEDRLKEEMTTYDNMRNTTINKKSVDGQIIVEVVTEDGYVYWIEDEIVEYKGTVDDIK